MRAAGEPHPDLEKGMFQEHCEMPGCDIEFQTTNYNVKTTPKQEYKIATGQLACPEVDTRDRKGRVVRVIKGIDKLKELPEARRAELVVAEIIAVVRRPVPMLRVFRFSPLTLLLPNLMDFDP